MFESDEHRTVMVVQKPRVVEMIYCKSCFKHFGCRADGEISFCDKRRDDYIVTCFCGKCSLGNTRGLVFGECSECYGGEPGTFFILEEGLCIL